MLQKEQPSIRLSILWSEAKTLPGRSPIHHRTHTHTPFTLWELAINLMFLAHGVSPHRRDRDGIKPGIFKAAYMEIKCEQH